MNIFKVVIYTELSISKSSLIIKILEKDIHIKQAKKYLTT